MERVRTADLVAWVSLARRSPLVLRGARQVGKTWLVRDLAARSGRELVELNFERDPRRARPFAASDPKEILAELSLILGREIPVDRSLLFLDEVQAAGTVLARLRWFAEEMVELPVIAAGSLLEFALGNHDFSMPVGRVGFLHVEPMGFDEYLRAHGQTRLLSALTGWMPGRTLSTTAHEQAIDWFRRYALVGGMPAVVAADVAGAPPRACRELQRDLIATFRADFAKYAGRMDREVLDHVLFAIARSLGRKFVCAHVGEGVKHHQAKRALELLAAARLCSLVSWSAATGLPLGGETKETFRKAILLDVGAFHALADTPAAGRWKDLAAGVRGQLAEQLVGQALRLGGEPTGDGPRLFYWQREGGRPGEIDFLIQAGGRIVPIEIKAGAAGAMKSLHQFMFDKSLSLAVRIDENPPSIAPLRVTTTQGDAVRYRLLGLPIYLAWRTAELAAGLPRR
ncbi:MAG: AAA family ATPase [Planctomycetes bacterium]|nr:AAA family ATPase [Planctomycetota bacterium]